jgi:hypothetical protein
VFTARYELNPLSTSIFMLIWSLNGILKYHLKTELPSLHMAVQTHMTAYSYVVLTVSAVSTLIYYSKFQRNTGLNCRNTAVYKNTDRQMSGFKLWALIQQAA